MKITIALFTIAFLPISLTHAQEKRRLDWQKFSNSIGETKIVEPVQFGKFTVFQIDNINKFLYKVEMSGKVFELQTPIPSELQALFRLSSADLEKTTNNQKAKEGVEQISKAIPPMQATSSETENDADEARLTADDTRVSAATAKTNAKIKSTELATAMNNVAVAQQDLSLNQAILGRAKTNKVAALVNQADKAVKSATTALTEVESRMKQVEKEASQSKLSAEIAQKAATEAQIIAENKAELDAILKEILTKCQEYLALSKIVSEEIFELKRTRNKLVGIAQLDESHGEINSRIPEAGIPSPNIKTDYLTLKALYHEVELLYESAEVAAETANASQAQKDRIKKSSERIEKADELIDQEALLGLLNDVDFLFAELTNKNNFIAVAPPVQMEDDFVTYTVNITPTSTRALAAFRSPMEFKFDVPTRGGWKTDFSVGPVISFGKGSRDAKYYFDGDVLKERKNRNVISPSMAALMHFYPRTGRNAAIGGLFGVGAGFQTISDVNLSLFAGLSYVLGKKQKIMLSGGVSYLRVDRLKTDQYKTDTNYTGVTIQSVTEKVFKASPFLSITYNLTTRVEN